MPQHGRHISQKRRNPRPNRGGSRPPLGPCDRPVEELKRALTHIHAPYNFVPLAGWVHCPDWGSKASHDLPFKEGLCGEIPYTLVAATPVLVGGEQKKSTVDAAGEVYFARSHGSYAIPGSALRGMLRAVIEIAAFGRMRQVDDARHGLRDISGPGARAYTNKVRNRVKTGFLRRTVDGTREIVPCESVRLSHRDLEQWWQEPKPIFKKGTSVREKYQRWEHLCKNHGIANSRAISFKSTNSQVSEIHSGRTGFPVLTGQISDVTDDRLDHKTGEVRIHGKYKDFIFHDPDEREAFTVCDPDWGAFLHVHADDEPDQSDRPWPGYWRQCFNRGKQIPVFYVEDGEDNHGQKHVCLGLAYMPKLAWDFSVHDLIRHTSKEHLYGPEEGGDYDFADLLFGALGNTQDRALKGRVNCGYAFAEDDPKPSTLDPTILNGPKPTYYPNYIKQRVDPKTWRLTSIEYATCLETQENEAPELRGFKRYPARPETRLQSLTSEQQHNKKVQVKLHPLPAGARFTGGIQFHNLKPEELGALIWALTWGGRENLRHGLGMGKPFGFGQVRFEVDWANTLARPNRNLAHVRPIDPDVYRARFTEHMEVAFRACRQKGTWAESEQIASLVAMADPARAAAFPGKLRHMRLERCTDPSTNRSGNINEFLWAKQAKPKPLALAEYAKATDTPETSGARSAPLIAASAASGEGNVPKHPWLTEKVTELARAHNAKTEDILGGKPLAEAWRGMNDAEQRASVLDEIKQLWKARGWWDDPPGKSKRQAKSIYTEGATG